MKQKVSLIPKHTHKDTRRHRLLQRQLEFAMRGKNMEMTNPRSLIGYDEFNEYVELCIKLKLKPIIQP